MSSSPFQPVHFDLVDLGLYIRVAEASSLTRGAECSCLSVAAASLRIKNMELALGTKLLYRSKRGVSLTDAGTVFLGHARAVIGQMSRMHEEMQPFSRGVRGHVRLFANPVAVSEVLPSVMARFFQTHNSITVDLREGLSMEIVRAVHDGSADIGVIAAQVRADDLETFPYKTDRLVLAVPLDHPLAELDSVQFAHALDYDFVGLDSHSAVHKFLQQEVAQLGREMRQRLQVSSFDAMCRMVDSGIAVGVLPALAANRHAKTARIKLVELEDEWAVRELRICVRRRDELAIFARELIDFILQSS